MKLSTDELIAVLAQFNPWWRNGNIAELPMWRRASFHELFHWVHKPPAPRAVLLSGTRQIGKTTLLLQIIDELLKSGVPAANILYATFDHPLIKSAGIDAVLAAWREREPKVEGVEYLFLDEAQFVPHWGTWVKHQVDFFKNRRIAFTGSATPLLETEPESGVGRWHTIRLSTLSFYEYLQLKQINLPTLPSLNSLNELFGWQPSHFHHVIESATAYLGHFHEYLVRGGFPQTTQIESLFQAQRLLREDIIDKTLKRDMTLLFGVRRIFELEQLFLYLCMHDGGLLDMLMLCSNLEIKRPTAQNFIELLEAAHLIYALHPFGYGKEILRARSKIYLADAAIAPAVLLKGKEILDDPTALGIMAETSVFKHLLTHYDAQGGRLTYWQDRKKQEVDLIVEIGNKLIPFEVKYRSQQHTGIPNIKGLLSFCEQKPAEYGFVITKSIEDFGLLPKGSIHNTQIMRLPAALLCYWLGEQEFSSEFKED